MTLYPRLVALVRIMLGIEFTVNGLNWWVKLIGPYPSIADFSGGHLPPSDFVGAMIATGFLFHIVKALELAAGVALLANRFVPLALVVVFPVTMNVFFVDVLISTHLRAHIMGTGALVMSLFLMLAWFGHYAPILAIDAPHDPLSLPVAPPSYIAFVWSPPFRRALFGLGLIAAAFGAVMLTWVGIMIIQYFNS